MSSVRWRGHVTSVQYGASLSCSGRTRAFMSGGCNDQRRDSVTCRLSRTSVCLESKTAFNVLIACWSSTFDQAESASLACSIEHAHNFTVILPHRMQGMIPSLLAEI